MIQIVVAALIVAVAAAVAFVLNRRERHGRPVGTAVPTHVDAARLGLARGGVLVFIDPTCTSCAAVVDTVKASGLPHAVVDVTDNPEHGVRDVPMTLLITGEGEVTKAWLGGLPADALESGGEGWVDG